jgi:hypothetical protein
MKANTNNTAREQELIRELAHWQGTRAVIDSELKYCRSIWPASSFVRSKEVTRYAITGRITSIHAELAKLNPEKWG